MKLVNLEDFELDQFGRAKLSVEDLQLLDEMGRVSLSGGDGINYGCPGSSNISCNNQTKCELTSNSAMCSNAGNCDTSLNKTRCYNVPEQMDLAPE